MIKIEDIKRYLKCSILYWKDASKQKKAFPLTQNYLSYRKIKSQFSKYIIANTTLTYKNFEVDIPLLHKKNNKWYLFLPVYQFSEIFYYKHDIEFIYYVCYQAGISINTIYAAVVNQDIKQPLFQIKRVNLKEILKLDEKFLLEYGILLKNINKIEKPVFRKVCLENGKCNCINQCFNLSNNSIMYYRGLSIEEKMEKNINDIITEDIIPSNSYTKAQIAATKNGIYYNIDEIQNFIKKLVFPLVYLDFEWDTILNHQSRKREDVLFSYAMIIENNEMNSIKYFSFSELDIIEHLLEKIPLTGSIIVYNALGGEALQLKRLSRKYPKYTEKIKAVIERIVDLEYIFNNGYYYDERFIGKSALKNIMKILPMNQDFEFSDAISAVEAYRSLEQAYDEKVINEILKYNYYDVYALHLIIQLLQKLK